MSRNSERASATRRRMGGDESRSSLCMQPEEGTNGGRSSSLLSEIVPAAQPPRVDFHLLLTVILLEMHLFRWMLLFYWFLTLLNVPETSEWLQTLSRFTPKVSICGSGLVSASSSPERRCWTIRPLT
ncbi:hypothetical protein BDZ89DRAFT_576332 [Hymenopellis radicata]|nr:hypothetical protein BDZ89DRAFT_576332 [Hymenopellis radicata]